MSLTAKLKKNYMGSVTELVIAIIKRILKLKNLFESCIRKTEYFHFFYIGIYIFTSFTSCFSRNCPTLNVKRYFKAELLYLRISV